MKRTSHLWLGLDEYMGVLGDEVENPAAAGALCTWVEGEESGGVRDRTLPRGGRPEEEEEEEEEVEVEGLEEEVEEVE